MIVPDPQAGDGKYFVKHLQATQCSSYQAPRLLEVPWCCTNGMKTPAKRLTLSEVCFGCLQSCLLFGFPQVFLQ